MAGETVKVEGLSELLANLEALPRELASKNGGPLSKALRKAANLIRDDAEARAPSDTGNLRRQIRAMRSRNPREHGATELYMVGVRRTRMTAKAKKNAPRTKGGKIDRRAAGDAFYWRFIEFGAYGGKVAAKPFLRPAFEARKEQALTTFKDELAAGIKAAVAKLDKGRR